MWGAISRVTLARHLLGQPFDVHINPAEMRWSVDCRQCRGVYHPLVGMLDWRYCVSILALEYFQGVFVDALRPVFRHLDRHGPVEAMGL